MKTLFTLLTTIVMLGAVTIASAQTETTTYQSKSGVKNVPATEAYYFTIEKAGPDGLITSVQFLISDSTKVRQQTYRKQQEKDVLKKNLHGTQYEWHRNGKLYSEATYANGKPVGVHRNWHETGELNYIEKYNANSERDTLEAYHKNGKIRRLEVYKSGEMISGNVYDEAGNELKFFPMLQMPSFPGGEYAMQLWLAKNIKFPAAAVKAKAQGLVLVSFVVDEAGNIIDTEAIRSVHPAADAEALRVVNSMPLWEPGLLEGKPVKVKYVIPVRFSTR